MINKSTVSNKVIITGAGFSANWGFPIATQLTTELLTFATRDNLNNIKKLALDDKYIDRFEDLYEEVQTNASYAQGEKEALNHFITQVFNECHKNIAPLGNDLRDNFRELLLTLQSITEKTFVFTVNFDILLEILSFTYKMLIPMTMPGFDKVGELSLNLSKGNADRDNYLKKYRIDERGDIDRRLMEDLSQQKPPFYIKLHGSFNWEKKEDSKSIMVLGGNKLEQIDDPTNILLNKYKEIFTDVLQKENLKILFIGYSFNDKHWDDLLVDAVQNRNARLYIINPSSLKAWLSQSQTRRSLQNAIDYYLPKRFDDMSRREFTVFKDIFFR